MAGISNARLGARSGTNAHGVDRSERAATRCRCAARGAFAPQHHGVGRSRQATRIHRGGDAKARGTEPGCDRLSHRPARGGIPSSKGSRPRMTRVLSVREIRDAVRSAAGVEHESTTPATLPLLGRLFHEVFARLTTGPPADNMVAALEDADANVNAW